MDSPARVALIMTFRNEAASLPGVLASLAEQTIGLERVRLIAVDNGSNDGSGAIVRAWLRTTGVDGEVLDVATPSIPGALNAAIKRAGPDEYVVRLDAHTLYAENYLEEILHAFADLPDDAWCVGGLFDVVAPGSLGHQLHAALFESPMGLGSADHRSPGGVREVSSVYLGAWRPGTLQRLGGYDTAWQANEDAELAERIRAAGGRIFCIPAKSRKILTRGARSALMQWHRYGWWRAQTLKRHPKAVRLRHLAPPLAVLAACALAASPRRRWLVVPILAYMAAVWTRRPAAQPLVITLATTLYFPLVQAAYGIGMLTGAVTAPARNAAHAVTVEAPAPR